MRPDRNLHRGASQRGFAIVAGIFLLLLMAALGALMVTLSSTSNVTSAQDIQGVRAYQAARAGLEWGIYSVTRPAAPQCDYSPATLPTLAGDLAPFVVTVACVSTSVIEGADVTGPKTVILYDISSTATLGTVVGSANYVERKLQATVERP